MNVQKESHEQELARAQEKYADLLLKLDDVRAMRDVLLETHQDTEVRLTADARELMRAVEQLKVEVETRRMHMEHRGKVSPTANSLLLLLLLKAVQHGCVCMCWSWLQIAASNRDGAERTFRVVQEQLTGLQVRFWSR
jgi:hypothetical protein